MLLVPQLPGLLSTRHDKLDQPKFSVTSDFPEDADTPAEDVPDREKPRLQNRASQWRKMAKAQRWLLSPIIIALG